MHKWHILAANINFEANILITLPVYILKNLHEYFSAICRQNYNLLFQPSIDYEDPHISFFWKAHTVSVLIFLILCLVYVGVIEDPVDTDSGFNSKRGIYAALFFWVFAGMTIMPDGPFMRPHPLIWRAAFAVSIVYELLLIYTLFQVRITIFLN